MVDPVTLKGIWQGQSLKTYQAVSAVSAQILDAKFQLVWFKKKKEKFQLVEDNLQPFSDLWATTNY